MAQFCGQEFEGVCQGIVPLSVFNFKHYFICPEYLSPRSSYSLFNRPIFLIIRGCISQYITVVLKGCISQYIDYCIRGVQYFIYSTVCYRGATSLVSSLQ